MEKKLPTSFETFGIQCGPGWKSLYEPLIEQCKKKAIVVRQIKEKFGGLRFYIVQHDSELQKAINQACRDSFHMCEKCGNPGQLVNQNGWYQTRCVDCVRKTGSLN